MTTSPAGRLPGALPWRVMPFGLSKYIADSNGKDLFSFPASRSEQMEAFVAWINSAGAQIAEREEEAQRWHSEAMQAKTQLAAANERIAEAEKVLANIAKQRLVDEVREAGEYLEADFEGGYDSCVLAARALLNRAKEGKTDE